MRRWTVKAHGPSGAYVVGDFSGYSGSHAIWKAKQLLTRQGNDDMLSWRFGAWKVA